MTQNAVNNVSIGDSYTALLNYNGITQTVRSKSANISSVTYSGVGQYIVNFVPSFTDTFYVPIIAVSNNTSTVGDDSGQTGYIDSNSGNPTSAALYIAAYGLQFPIAYHYYDDDWFCVTVYGT